VPNLDRAYRPFAEVWVSLEVLTLEEWELEQAATEKEQYFRE
jgi:hypothetical protein